MLDCRVVEDDSQSKYDQAHQDWLESGVLGFFLDKELDLIDRVRVKLRKALHEVSTIGNYYRLKD